MSALQKLPQLTIQKSIRMNRKTPKDFHNSYQLKIYCEASLFLANLFVKKKKKKQGVRDDAPNDQVFITKATFCKIVREI